MPKGAATNAPAETIPNTRPRISGGMCSWATVIIRGLIGPDIIPVRNNNPATTGNGGVKARAQNGSPNS